MGTGTRAIRPAIPRRARSPPRGPGATRDGIQVPGKLTKATARAHGSQRAPGGRVDDGGSEGAPLPLRAEAEGLRHVTIATHRGS